MFYGYLQALVFLSAHKKDSKVAVIALNILNTACSTKQTNYREQVLRIAISFPICCFFSWEILRQSHKEREKLYKRENLVVVDHGV
jgi:hypothetical protein